MRMKVGFIGLGIMGRPMAGHLHQGRARAVSPQPQRRSAGSARRRAGSHARSGREVAERADMIITMVPDTPDVERCCSASDGVAEGL